jgi:hypothetical protein
LFFNEKGAEEGLDKKLSDLTDNLKTKFGSFGSWSQSNPFLVGAFLQEYLGLRGIVDEANNAQIVQSE